MRVCDRFSTAKITFDSEILREERVSLKKFTTFKFLKILGRRTLKMYRRQTKQKINQSKQRKKIKRYVKFTKNLKANAQGYTVK